MYRRLDAVSHKLDWVGPTHLASYVPMLRRMAGDQPIDALKILADVVRPADLDPRDETNKYSQQFPLNRLVDAARAESLPVLYTRGADDPEDATQDERRDGRQIVQPSAPAAGERGVEKRAASAYSAGDAKSTATAPRRSQRMPSADSA